MAGRRILLLSNSKEHGGEIFEWCADVIKSFLSKSNVKTLLFIPYASKDYDGYAQRVSAPFEKLGYSIDSIHNSADPVKSITDCKAILIGGGNTFLLLKTLYEHNLLEPIRRRVLEESIPYIGSSAGSNVATRSICTTNDMPICYPPSFEALNLLPFNINPHYIDPDVNSKHMGETRDDRIKEYLKMPDCAPVLGLRECCCLLVEGMKATLHGKRSAKLFQKDKEAIEFQPGSDLSFLLQTECN